MIQIEDYPMTSEEILQADQLSRDHDFYYIDEVGSTAEQVEAAFATALKQNKLSFTKLWKDVENYVAPQPNEIVDLKKRPRWNGKLYKPTDNKFLFALVAKLIK